MKAWPDDPRSDQVHQEQIRDRDRVQQDIQEAWDRVMISSNLNWKIYERTVLEADIKLLKWALGVK